jgi:RimJ/RimL family protein N-acetyltransferase
VTGRTPKISASDVRLRAVRADDLAVFFEHQQDPEALHMAAFTTRDPADRGAFDAHWTRILADDTVITRTIVVGDEVAGHVARFERDGVPEVTYWIGRRHWGRGVATAALAAFLRRFPQRPLHARVAKDNAASVRVLSKCGFVVTGEDKGFAHARGAVVEEYVMVLGAAVGSELE